jgi:hypothetical protein
MLALAGAIERLERDGAYASVTLLVDGGDIVRVKVERSAKTIEELARFGQPSVGSATNKGD